MKASLELYSQLDSILQDAKDVCEKISKDETPSMAKFRLQPVINRADSFHEWFESMEDVEETEDLLKQVKELKKTKEGREQLKALVAKIQPVVKKDKPVKDKPVKKPA